MPVCRTSSAERVAPALDSQSQLETETGLLSGSGVRRLVVVGADGVRYVPLPHRGELLVGRGSDAAVRIDHPRVSRRHALFRVDDEVLVEDLESANGTQIGATRLEPHRAMRLGPGVVVNIGESLLMLDAPLRATEFNATETSTMAELGVLLQRVARSNISVILVGETGAGKEVFAEKIHAASPRAGAALVRLNCAALPEALLESELFGYERGAFTGAVKSKPGLLEWGDRGSIFLDEIGEMPLATQAKLLRVLENRELTRLGGLKPTRIDVRFICATHRDLGALVASGTFREDLYFRLNGMTISVPPLRERRDEILPLAERFLTEAAAELGEPAPSLTPAAADKLLSYAWPGNVRELRNAVERALVIGAGQPLMPDHFALGVAVNGQRSCRPPPRRTTPPAGTLQLKDEVMALERQRIVEALERSAGNQTEAARMLNMPRRTLLSRLDQYGITRPRKR